MEVRCVSHCCNKTALFHCSIDARYNVDTYDSMLEAATGYVPWNDGINPTIGAVRQVDVVRDADYCEHGHRPIRLLAECWIGDHWDLQILDH